MKRYHINFAYKTIGFISKPKQNIHFASKKMEGGGKGTKNFIGNEGAYLFRFQRKWRC